MNRAPLPPFADLLRSGADTLDAEILAEKASALGRSGAALEKALAALRACAEPREERRALAYAAAAAAQAHFIQRELSGWRRHDDVIRQFDIPPEVLGKIGATPR